MTAQLGVKFFYLFCDDLAAMRYFYSELLGLNEIYFSDGGLGYHCDGLQFTIFESEEVRPATDGWAWQPGWREGTQAVISWSVSLDEAGFRAAIANVKLAHVPSFWETPQWRQYWSFPVKDPMGNTVELVWDVGEVSAENPIWEA